MDYFYFPSYKLTSMDADELFFLETVQEGITGLRLLQAHQSLGEARHHVYQVKHEHEQDLVLNSGGSVLHQPAGQSEWTWHQSRPSSRG